MLPRPQVQQTAEGAGEKVHGRLRCPRECTGMLTGLERQSLVPGWADQRLDLGGGGGSSESDLDGLLNILGFYPKGLESLESDSIMGVVLGQHIIRLNFRNRHLQTEYRKD